MTCQLHTRSVFFANFSYFQVVVNHEKITKQLAKACSRIADLLPRIGLSAALYQTERVKEEVARLHACIMNFIIQAIRWYRQGKLSHIWTAISKPWDLDLVDHVENIGEQARRVENLVQSAGRAELRDMHVKLQDALIELWEMRREYQKSQADIQKLLQIAQGRKHLLCLYIWVGCTRPNVMLEVKRPNFWAREKQVLRSYC